MVNKLSSTGNILIKDTTATEAVNSKFASTKNFIDMVDDLHYMIDSNHIQQQIQTFSSIGAQNPNSSLQNTFPELLNNLKIHGSSTFDKGHNFN